MMGLAMLQPVQEKYIHIYRQSGMLKWMYK